MAWSRAREDRPDRTKGWEVRQSRCHQLKGYMSAHRVNSPCRILGGPRKGQVGSSRCPTAQTVISCELSLKNTQPGIVHPSWPPCQVANRGKWSQVSQTYSSGPGESEGSGGREEVRVRPWLRPPQFPELHSRLRAEPEVQSCSRGQAAARPPLGSYSLISMAAQGPTSCIPECLFQEDLRGRRAQPHWTDGADGALRGTESGQGQTGRGRAAGGL